MMLMPIEMKRHNPDLIRCVAEEVKAALEAHAEGCFDLSRMIRERHEGGMPLPYTEKNETRAYR